MGLGINLDASVGDTDILVLDGPAMVLAAVAGKQEAGLDMHLRTEKLASFLVLLDTCMEVALVQSHCTEQPDVWA